MNMNLSDLQEIVKDGGAWHAAVHGSQRVEHDLATEQQHYLIQLVVKQKLTQHCKAFKYPN